MNWRMAFISVASSFVAGFSAAYRARQAAMKSTGSSLASAGIVNLSLSMNAICRGFPGLLGKRQPVRMPSAEFPHAV